MSIEWLVTSDDVKIIAEAVFWLCVAALSPVIYKVTYYLMTPLWIKLFPTKKIELRYHLDGKIYTALVDASSDLSAASTSLRLVAERKAGAAE